jgi:hypothetical protein
MDELRSLIENAWTIFTDPRDGERKKYIEQAELLDLIEELGL